MCCSETQYLPSVAIVVVDDVFVVVDNDVVVDDDVVVHIFVVVEVVFQYSSYVVVWKAQNGRVFSKTFVRWCQARLHGIANRTSKKYLKIFLKKSSFS